MKLFISIVIVFWLITIIQMIFSKSFDLKELVEIGVEQIPGSVSSGTWSRMYDFWLEVQKRTHAEISWDNFYGWQDFKVYGKYHYCDEAKLDCKGCSLYNSRNFPICSNFNMNKLPKWYYIEEMQKYKSKHSFLKTNWKRAKDNVDIMVGAIKLDGIRWKYLEDDFVKSDTFKVIPCDNVSCREWAEHDHRGNIPNNCTKMPFCHINCNLFTSKEKN
jgi:hypothetical protein